MSAGALSHRVRAVLDGPKGGGVARQDVLDLVQDIMALAEQYRPGDIMIDTLRSWVGKVQEHACM